MPKRVGVSCVNKLLSFYSYAVVGVNTVKLFSARNTDNVIFIATDFRDLLPGGGGDGLYTSVDRHLHKK